MYDLNRSVTTFLTVAPALGFTNTTTACLVIDPTAVIEQFSNATFFQNSAVAGGGSQDRPTTPSIVALLNSLAPTGACSHPDQYVFYDLVRVPQHRLT